MQQKQQTKQLPAKVVPKPLFQNPAANYSDIKTALPWRGLTTERLTEYEETALTFVRTKLVPLIAKGLFQGKLQQVHINRFYA